MLFESSILSINSTKINVYYFSDGVITLYPVPKIPTDNIVDTNGAGDAFIGGKIYLNKKNQLVIYILKIFFS